MPTYYVGPGGNDGNAGTSWALRKLTLNGAEDIPVQAGDVVYVAPGTYRETLTVDVSGSAGSPVTYVGDYTGANTDGVGGVVRITGSDNDQTAARAACITANSKNYRTFRCFLLDMTSNYAINLTTPGAGWTIDQNAFMHTTGGITFGGNDHAGYVLSNLYFSSRGLCINISGIITNAGHAIDNCLVIGNNNEFSYVNGIGGVTYRNCSVIGAISGVRISGALPVGHTVVTVNNSVFAGLSSVALRSVNLGELVEDYNSFFANSSDRLSVNTGANSNTYPPLFDTRWFFEMVNGGSMVTPFDLASYSQLVNVAGTSPPATDMRGTSVIGAQREWGALEFDPDLDIEAGTGGGGAVSISPWRGNIG